MGTRKPVWRTSSFLVYAGGLTVLGGAFAALAYLAAVRYGKDGLTGWALLMVVVLAAVGEVLRRRGRWVVAGVFGFVSVLAWTAFLAFAWDWFGWVDRWNRPFGSWTVAHLSLELLVLVGAFRARRHWDFPWITLLVALAGWFFVTDFVSNGGGWSYVVTLLVGLAYLAAGSGGDQPSAFWLHVVAGALIGASLLHWWHSTDTDWALISAASLVYVLVAYATRRSSWAVYGTIGFFGSTVHYLASSAFSGFPSSVPSFSGWSPAVALGCLGFWLALLGLLGRRRAEG